MLYSKDAKLCLGYVTTDCTVRDVQRERCVPCAKHYKSVLRKSKRPTRVQRLSGTNDALRMRYKNISRKNSRLRKKILRLKKKVESVRTECAQASSQAIDEAIAKLPNNHLYKHALQHQKLKILKK